MSLKQKFTWAQFIKEQGAAAKDLKRTSPEGAKAFAAAQKSKIKEYVKERLARLEKEKKAAEKGLETLRGSLKGLNAAARRKAVLKRISKTQHTIRDRSKSIARDQSREL